METKPRTIHLVLLAACSAALVHCAETSMQTADGAFDTGMNEANSMATTATNATSQDGNNTSETTAMNVDGTLAIASGAIDLSASSMITTVYVGLESSELLCTQTGIRSAEASKSPRVDDALYGWWDLEPEPSTDCGAVPEVLGFGIGEYNALLDSRVIARGEDPKSLSYSVYVKLDEQKPLWVFGIADYASPAAPEQTDSGSPATPSELPDGIYSFTGIVLIPLP